MSIINDKIIELLKKELMHHVQTCHSKSVMLLQRLSVTLRMENTLVYAGKKLTGKHLLLEELKKDRLLKKQLAQKCRKKLDT